MAGAFEVATRSAIREIVVDAVQESKYGYVMTHEALQRICDQLFDLMLTSRSLKSAGDRLIAQGIFPGGSPPAPMRKAKARV